MLNPLTVAECDLLGETVGQVLDETGLSAEELARMFDTCRRRAE